MENPLVYAVVLVYNGKSNLVSCLPSIAATYYDNLKVVVVDNASTDGSGEYVKEHFAQFEVVRTHKNLYYGGGNNVGINLALSRGAKYIAIFNDDIKVDPRWCTYAVQVLEHYPKVGYVELDLNDPMKHGSLETFEKASKEFKELQISEIEHTGGCATLVRADVFRSVGVHDETYLIYADDTDLCRRATRAGYQLKKINVPVYHYSSATMGKVKIKSAYLMMRNLVRLAIKNDPWTGKLKMFFFIMNCSVNPFKKIDRENTMEVRLRPKPVYLNVFIWLGAMLWNVVHLPQTLIIAHEEELKVRAAKKGLANENNHA